MVCPAIGVPSEVFFIVSAAFDPTMIVADALLSCVLSSGVVVAAVAVLVIDPDALGSMSTVMVAVFDPPVATVPRLQLIIIYLFL